MKRKDKLISKLRKPFGRGAKGLPIYKVDPIAAGLKSGTTIFQSFLHFLLICMDSDPRWFL